MSDPCQRPETVLKSITVGSRLHFGLYAFEHPTCAYGGIGLMLQSPSLCLTATEADRFEVRGELTDRIRRFANKWTESTSAALPAVAVESTGNLKEHVGLGCGTQVGLAVFQLLNHFCDLSKPALERMADAADRGKRSVVGSYGFEQGGFIYESGHASEDAFPDLLQRIAVPEQWRFVLAIERETIGQFGATEAGSFRTLPPMDPAMTEKLKSLAETQLIPALLAADIEAFGEAVYQYGCQAGDCYRMIQNGRYANPFCESIVQEMREFGIHGVGQSSWGPTIFGLCDSANQAAALSGALRRRYPDSQLQLEICSPLNHGACVASMTQ